MAKRKEAARLLGAAPRTKRSRRLRAGLLHPLPHDFGLRNAEPVCDAMERRSTWHGRGVEHPAERRLGHADLGRLWLLALLGCGTSHERDDDWRIWIDGRERTLERVDVVAVSGGFRITAWDFPGTTAGAGADADTRIVLTVALDPATPGRRRVAARTRWSPGAPCTGPFAGFETTPLEGHSPAITLVACHMACILCSSAAPQSETAAGRIEIVEVHAGHVAGYADLRFDPLLHVARRREPPVKLRGPCRTTWDDP